MNNRDFITRRITNAFIATKEANRSTFRSLLTRRVTGYIDTGNTLFYKPRSASELLLNIFAASWEPVETKIEIVGYTYFNTDDFPGKSNKVDLSKMHANMNIHVFPNAYNDQLMLNYCTVKVPHETVCVSPHQMLTYRPVDNATILLSNIYGTEVVLDIYPGDPLETRYITPKDQQKIKTVQDAIDAGFTCARIA